MPDDHDRLLPSTTISHDMYEKVLTKGDQKVGYVWYKGRKFPVSPYQTIIRIPTLSVHPPMRDQDE